jgi:hypothetical protein
VKHPLQLVVAAVEWKSVVEEMDYYQVVVVAIAAATVAVAAMIVARPLVASVAEDAVCEKDLPVAIVVVRRSRRVANQLQFVVQPARVTSIKDAAADYSRVGCLVETRADADVTLASPSQFLLVASPLQLQVADVQRRPSADASCWIEIAPLVLDGAAADVELPAIVVVSLHPSIAAAKLQQMIAAALECRWWIKFEPGALPKLLRIVAAIPVKILARKAAVAVADQAANAVVEIVGLRIAIRVATPVVATQVAEAAAAVEALPVGS